MDMRGSEPIKSLLWGTVTCAASVQVEAQLKLVLRSLRCREFERNGFAEQAVQSFAAQPRENGRPEDPFRPSRHGMVGGGAYSTGTRWESTGGRHANA